MGAIGISLLAEPLAGYYADSTIIQAQQKRLEVCRQIHEQQKELLANADNPYVIERLAIDKLNYVPASELEAKTIPLPDTWPKLEDALTEIEQSRTLENSRPYEHLIQNITKKPVTKSILMILGSALVVISLGFFYRQNGDN
jgi:hypothetical protein